MKLDRAVIDGFSLWSGADQRGVAVAVLEKAGRGDAWNADIGPSAVSFLCGLANTVAEVLWDDDPVIDIPVRAEQIARDAMYGVDRGDSPAILYGIAPQTRLPAGTIGDLCRDSRAKLQQVLIPMVGKVLREWANDGLIRDTSRE